MSLEVKDSTMILFYDFCGVHDLGRVNALAIQFDSWTPVQV